MGRGEATRRDFVAGGLGLGVGLAGGGLQRLAMGAEARGAGDLVKGIDRAVIWNGRAGGDDLVSSSGLHGAGVEDTARTDDVTVN